MKYRVLWIDDEHREQADFLELAEDHEIDIIPFESFESGFKELEKDLNAYDAVILDALSFKYADQEKGTEDGKGLKASIKRLSELSHQRKIPYFVYTGQYRRFGQSYFEDEELEPYIKGKDQLRLFKDIKAAAKDNENAQLRFKHSKAFAVFSDKYLGPKAERYLLDCLRYMGQVNSMVAEEREDYLNKIRKVIEAFFHACHNYGLLDDACIVRNKVNLTRASLYLSGRDTRVEEKKMVLKCEKAHFPRMISSSVKHLLDRTNTASHYNDADVNNDEIDENLQYFQEYEVSPYLLHSLTYQLMDVLCWFKEYADNNPDSEENKKLQHSLSIAQNEYSGVGQEKLPPITGPLLFDGRAYYVKDCEVLNKIVQGEGFELGKEITLHIYTEHNRPGKYKYFCAHY